MHFGVAGLWQASVLGQVLFCSGEEAGALGVPEAGGTKAFILSCGRKHFQRRHGAWLKGSAWLQPETAAGGRGVIWKYQHASVHCESSVQVFDLNVHNGIRMFPSSLDQVHEGRDETRIFWIQLLEYI